MSDLENHTLAVLAGFLFGIGWMQLSQGTRDALGAGFSVFVVFSIVVWILAAAVKKLRGGDDE